ncbi:MAG: thioredoxin domain-containing protein [Bacillota bacterium]
MKKKLFSFFGFIFLSFVFIGCNNSISQTEKDNTTEVTVETTNESINETTTQAKEYNYSDYSYYQIDSFSEQLNREEENYYIYYYYEGCSACASIKNDVLSIIAKLDEDYLFLFDVSRDINVEPSFNLEYVPTLVYVVDNRYSEKYVGPEDIKIILESLN